MPMDDEEHYEGEMPEGYEEYEGEMPPEGSPEYEEYMK